MEFAEPPDGLTKYKIEYYEYLQSLLYSQY